MPDMEEKINILQPIDTGLRTLELRTNGGGSVEVEYNPYDVKLIAAILDATEKLDAIQAKLTPLSINNWREIYEACMKADKEMREILDGLFNVPICEALFPNQTVQAIGNGFPAWANLLCAVLDVMDAGLTSEKNSAKARIRKYSGKYKK
jgi:hypothetical protein